MKKFPLIAMATISLLIAGIAMAQPTEPPEAPRPEWTPGGPPMGMGGGPQFSKDDDDFMPGRWDDMKLTDDQKAKLDKMIVDHRTKMLDYHSDMVVARTQMKKLLIADKYDEKAVSETAAKIGKLQEQRSKMMAEHLRKVRDMLTDDQRVTFDKRVLSGSVGPGMDSGPMGRGGPGMMGRGMHRSR